MYDPAYGQPQYGYGGYPPPQPHFGYDPALALSGPQHGHHPAHPAHGAHPHAAHHAMQQHHAMSPIQQIAQFSHQKFQPVEQIQVMGLTATVAVAAGASATVSNLPQRTFQCKRFVWGSTSSGFFQLLNLFFGQDSMFAAQGGVDAEIFSQTGVGVDLYGFVAVAGIQVSMLVTNTDSVSHTPSAAIIGPTIV